MENLSSLVGRPLLFIDFETTGIDPRTAMAIEVAGSKHYLDGSRYDFRTFINPGVELDIPENITEITGITNKDIENAPTFSYVYDVLLERLIKDNPIIVAHNAIYDATMLKSEQERNGWFDSWDGDVICTMSLAALLRCGKASFNKANRPYTSYKLGDVCEVVGVVLDGAHRAENDIIATEEIFRLLYPRAIHSGIEVINVIAHRSWAPLPAYMPSHYTVKYIK